jgi:long-chain acyl-CoA synthetase
VLSGYGLAETASMFTGNAPSDRRLASAGKSLADGEIRISGPDDKGVGEIELRGRSITTGYLNNPEANRTSFTSDGWFRTGDLGFVDHDGFLHVTGRSKELLVLGGGKKVNPEDLERFYGSAPQIREVAVLEQQGMLTALVRPDPSRVREMGTMNLREGIRVVLAEKAQNLPIYQRLSGFALTDQPLPRTRLGKYRRFLLPALYQEALAGGPRRQARLLGPEDQALLRDPTANTIWMLLRERYPKQAVDLDVSLGLDLNLDSFGWMELTITLQDRYGVRLTEADIATIDTIRDLLVRCKDRQRAGHAGEPSAAAEAVQISHLLAPTGPLVTLLGVLLYAINWCVMRGLFRLRVEGTQSIPDTGAFVITPNHASYLDPLVIAAALPLSRLKRIYWAGSVTLRMSFQSTSIALMPRSRLPCRCWTLVMPQFGFLKAGVPLTASCSASFLGSGRSCCEPAPPQFPPLSPEHSKRGRATAASRRLPRSPSHSAMPREWIACAPRAQVERRRRG